MKYIQKGKPPKALIEYKNTTPGASFESAPKGEIRVELIDEQGGLCAYCMRRISNKRNPKLRKYKTEIEHFKSQHRHPELELDSKNMLGVCNGNADNKHQLVCDKSKSKFDKTHDMFVNPLEFSKIQQIFYTPDGEILSDNEQIMHDVDIVLNLNEPNLVERRLQLYEETRKKIKQIKRSLWDKPQIKKSELQKLKTAWEKRYKYKYKNEKKEEVVVLIFRELCRVPLYLIEKELSKP